MQEKTTQHNMNKVKGKMPRLPSSGVFEARSGAGHSRREEDSSTTPSITSKQGIGRFCFGDCGLRREIIGEGTHFCIPLIEWPIMYDIRTSPRNIMSLTGSKDLQMVNINVRVLSQPKTSQLPDLYESLGLDYNEKVLPSIVNEVCKQVVAQYNAVQLLTMRDQVSRRVRQNLIDRASEFGIVVQDVALTEVHFGRGKFTP